MKLWHLAGVRCAHKGAGRTARGINVENGYTGRNSFISLENCRARLLNECDRRSFANNLDRRRLLEEKRPRGNIIGKTQFHKFPILC